MAPTPSGFLHMGNAVNLVLTAALASQSAGRLALRIDDMDAPRVREAYVQDIFDVLSWLGITWTVGPRDAVDHASRTSMSLRTEHYRLRLRDLEQAGVRLFTCSCSRSDVASGNRCIRDCREAGRPSIAGESAIRADLPAGVAIRVEGRDIALRETHGDVVLWRRDGLPAYHLANVVEDAELGTTDVVRGDDLIESTALHLWLARHLSDAPDIRYRHHGLVTGVDGSKLSKSQLAGGPLPRTQEQLDEVVALARRIGEPIGLARTW